MDLCRTGGCCPRAHVSKEGAVLVFPRDEVEIKETGVVIRMTREQVAKMHRMVETLYEER